MKKLEDKPVFRKMYDRLGQDQVTLLQERDRARNDTILRNKRKYQSIRSTKGQTIEYADVALDKPGEKKHFTTLDVSRNP